MPASFSQQSKANSSLPRKADTPSVADALILRSVKDDGTWVWAFVKAIPSKEVWDVLVGTKSADRSHNMERRVARCKTLEEANHRARCEYVKMVL